MSSVIIKFDYDRIWRQTYGSSKDDGPVHRYLHRIVRQILRALDYATVLDVGCGMGHNLPLLAEGHSLRTYTGVDISTFALKQAQTLAPSGSFHYLDVQRVHLDGNWDLVYCSLILEHLPDDVAALEHMRAMTGRYLLATTIAADFERYKAWDERIGHVRNYQRGTRGRRWSRSGCVSASPYTGAFRSTLPWPGRSRTIRGLERASSTWRPGSWHGCSTHFTT